MKNNTSIFRWVCLCAGLLFWCQTALYAQFWEGPAVNITNSPTTNTVCSFVAWGNGYGLVWRARDTIMFARIDKNGSIVQAPVPVYTPPEGIHDMWLETTSNGTNFVTMFTRRHLKDVQLCSVCINPDGTIKGTVNVIDEARILYRNMVPVWNGSFIGCFFIRVNKDGHALYFMPLDADGLPTGSEQLLYKGKKTMIYLDATWTGKYFAAAWNFNHKSIQFIRLKANGKIKGNVVTFTPEKPAKSVSKIDIVPYSRHRYGLSWSVWRPGDLSDVYFMRLKQNGVRQGNVIRLTTSAETPTSGWPCLEYNKDNRVFAVFWESTIHNPMILEVSGIFGAKISDTGTVVTKQHLLKSFQNGASLLEIANSGDTALLTWSIMYGEAKQDIYIMKMDSKLW